MSYRVERLPGEPVVVLTITGYVDVEKESGEIVRQVAALMQDIDGPGYRIADLSQLDLSFSQMVFALANTSRGQPGSATDPRARPIIVGTSDMVQLITNSLKQAQYGGRAIPLFTTLQATLDYVHAELGPSQPVD